MTDTYKENSSRPLLDLSEKLDLAQNSFKVSFQATQPLY